MTRVSFQNNLTLPARVGLKLSTWFLECVAGLLLTRLATAVNCPLRRWFRTFKMGILLMWMMENVRCLSGHLVLAELSPCRKSHGIYRRRERSRSREVCQPSLLFSLLSSGWKTVTQRGIKQCLGGLQCSKNTEKQEKAKGIASRRHSMHTLLI